MSLRDGESFFSPIKSRAQQGSQVHLNYVLFTTFMKENIVTHFPTALADLSVKQCSQAAAT